MMAKQSDKMLQTAIPTPLWLIVLRYFEKRQLAVEMQPGVSGMRILSFKVVRITSIKWLKRRYHWAQDITTVYCIDDFKGHLLKRRGLRVAFTEKGEEMLYAEGYSPKELLRIWRYGKRTVAEEKKSGKRRLK
ncbi:hypothetical protein KAR91_77140 [Candidatus Pacearchaeota archaeon]|nr:hypothetical protein [Candidatus Pacearchaeota archaeon]